MLIRRSFLLLILPVFLAACATAPAEFQPGTQLILVRHADRSGDLLNRIGEARAAALPDALQDYDIAAIYLPDVTRNRQTAAPLAAKLGLEPQVINAENPTFELLRAGAGQTILWVGNKGNLVRIWETLNAQGPPPVEYGDVAVVMLSPGGNLVVHRFDWEI
ncbi:Histidine phosphatase superfamily (branch 1) [Pseudooceanicola antarcticus]|uniref:Histidine phosphatase family protein n=1 Tax=Pseudooceanicola antarcticus TaxID=1247613 RepID=A0A285IEW9_9RHOB|nr:histidine phosphatase family protein [Pseudooceanicola antarcticus]PJE29136.1 histidine phosphatase family protein [Pseudooceanicola antarcticus]SNY46538.1 Histidine phosphatase superfamily (branch 1) [Pseudooceanicola antarcticus]